MSGGRVLIVDDDPDVAEALSDLLGLRGYPSDIAREGRSAIRAAHAKPYAVAVVDIGLPDMDGVDAMLEIQRIQPGVRAFLMTGYRSHDVATRARKAGAPEILIKPFDVSRLVRELEGGTR